MNKCIPVAWKDSGFETAYDERTIPTNEQTQ